ncbi:Ral guanine nucleotide dissociation stimulator-like [Dirofilaria immitis]
MTAAKYFGEEKLEDAIYAVYLRKVRYVSPPSIEFSDDRAQDIKKYGISLDNTDYLQWETIRERVVRAGTLEKLVECLISDDMLMDSRHFNVFFATYRSFATCSNVLELLLQRYVSLEMNSLVIGKAKTVTLQCSLRSVIMCWLEMYPEDFNEPGADFATLMRLIEFGRIHKITDLRTKARQLRESYKRQIMDGRYLTQIPSMEQYVFNTGYDAPDFDTCMQRANMFDIGKENCVQIAEQLTFWDAELFKELLPQQCQGCVWNKRNKRGPETVYTVKATIDQFNAVVQKVMTSIVLPDCRPDFRAKIIAKWIDVARELRALKNFSSLKAIISTLQSEPVHRLKYTWTLVSNASLTQFRELASIFNADNDGEESRARQILDEEGTAKKSPLRRPQLIQNCRRTKSDVNLAESQGTVPYLGTFLTDLSMIDQANPDFTEEGLINFEKRRKEFEIIAKIRLFQSACRAYKIPMDMAFCSWFCFLPALDENQCFIRSLEVELPTNQSDSSKQLRPSQVLRMNTLSRLISNMSIDENPNDSGQISNDSGIVTEDLWYDGVTKPFAEKTLINACSPFGIVSSRSFTAPPTPAKTFFWKGSEFSPNTAFSRSTSGCWDRKYQPNDVSVSTSLNSYGNMTPETSSGSCISASSLQQTAPFHLARVALDDSMKNDTSTANYKCVKIENGDRMAELIERTLEKHLICGDHSEYCLVQLLPDGYEFCLPEKCNPYYAVVPDPTSTMLNFVLRRKSDAERMAAPGSIAPSAKKLNKMKRCNLLRWSSGYL